MTLQLKRQFPGTRTEQRYKTKAVPNLPKKQKEYEKRCSYSFSHTLPARYSVLHLLGVLSGDKHISEMFCCRET